MAKCLAGGARCLPGHNVARLAGSGLAVDPVDGTVRGKAVCCSFPAGQSAGPSAERAGRPPVIGHRGLVVQLLPYRWNSSWRWVWACPLHSCGDWG